MPHPADLTFKQSDHSKLKWLERTSGDESLTEALDRVVPVGADWLSGQALLHDPEGVVIVYKEGEIVTILNVNDNELGDNHLKVCEDCGNRWDPSATDSCHWCR